ncbi:N-acylglucosamine-6-phosphate 2-epimerase [Spinactinospora alkalitolerans]|uniref:Putative N-acetylmannosamine-6-phosphate 2-epimerase n=1 Tax=Spinactinospora alkalitolerans TaxID=687207 RepID=A0A852TXV2_9ACTN|nr:N-acetylmannosamine-6-phosphate 2-epimerase [Spinactinospora alkalitolerans]NYE47782.1 N-acylglucosamine-6-phosphate 2-epimerase [Spinactinospora alkalitolerans]
MPVRTILDALRGGLVVSCQAPPGDPLHGPRFMTAMALAAANGGAVGIRAEGIDDLRAIRAEVELPLIGLWKVGREGVYITPTPEHAAAVAATGADIVAVDATRRPRPGGHALEEVIGAVHASGRLAMADVADLDDALASLDAGADVVSTTLSGYVGGAPRPDGPDLGLVARIADRVSAPVFAEGRVSTPDQARRALDAGAFAVVVGTAITAPGAITTAFARALRP